MSNQPIRHGDISFHPVKSIPKSAKQVKHNGSFVVALGETTGHKHVIKAPSFTNFEVWEDGEDRYVVVKEPITISHEEHRTPSKIWLPGIYKQKQELEEDAFADVIRQVKD